MAWWRGKVVSATFLLLHVLGGSGWAGAGRGGEGGLPGGVGRPVAEGTGSGVPCGREKGKGEKGRGREKRRGGWRGEKGEGREKRKGRKRGGPPILRGRGRVDRV